MHQKPRRFKLPDDIDRPFPAALRFGVYFPDTDLCVNDMGHRGTGEPKDVEWLDEASEWKLSPAGTLYWVGEPEMKGTITPRGELQTTSADPPVEGKFFIQEYSGGEVFRIVDGEFVAEPIKDHNGLKDGDAVACPSLVGYFRATIQVSADGSVRAVSPSGYHIGMLDFDQDDRHCWTCSGTANIKGLKKLDLESNP